MSSQPILIAGKWRTATSRKTFTAENPATGERLPEEFPVSDWADCDQALAAAAAAARDLRQVGPTQIASFLKRYAERIEARATELVAMAHQETALPKKPRLADVELPRTTDQLRQAAAAVLEGSWCLPTIDTKLNLRSYLAPLGPVLVFGPNNFPFAYNCVAGGDFVSAIAAGNPVIAKAHPCHPATTRLLAEEAFAALGESKLPLAALQLLYDIAPENGLRCAADSRLGGIGFTGSRPGGLKLKAATDGAGKPAYLEMSSVNPVVMLPGALVERHSQIAGEFVGSCLAGDGQFCTSPGLVIVMAGNGTEAFIQEVKARLEAAPPSTLLSAGVAKQLAAAVESWRRVGAVLVTGGNALPGPGYHFANTLLRVEGKAFLATPAQLQNEAFGNASLMVVARDPAEAARVIEQLDGNLTGSIYSDSRGADDALYADLAPRLRPRVGRFLNDKMPTGVAVAPAMNHGGPFPATGHPGFTAVGIPATFRRFTMLQCFDHVRPDRLPVPLRDKNPNGQMWRLIDGSWSQASVVI
jgi:NADP-dependent aldehyde dehydrogenase